MPEAGWAPSNETSFICVGIFPACMYVRHTHAWSPLFFLRYFLDLTKVQLRSFIVTLQQGTQSLCAGDAFLTFKVV